MHKKFNTNIIYFTRFSASTNKTSPSSKSKISKKLNTYLVMSHKTFEDFFLQLARNSCFNLALIQPDRKFSMPFFA